MNLPNGGESKVFHPALSACMFHNMIVECQMQQMSILVYIRNSQLILLFQKDQHGEEN